jgi:hypothetical protein
MEHNILIWFNVIDFVSSFQNCIKYYFRDAILQRRLCNKYNLRVVWCKCKMEYHILKQEHKLQVLKKTLVKYSVDLKSIHRKYFHALFQ